MKTKLEIEFKIMIHEEKINELLNDKEEWNNFKVELLNNYRQGRKALVCVLSPDDFITNDEYDKKVSFEIQCYESSKIF
jgi:hypothetical protein